MSEIPRLKRPEPARTAPIRAGWLSLFAGGGAGDGSSESPGEGESERERPPSTDPVARAVELGYRVVDDYVRQGQDVAKRFTSRRAAAGVGGDVQDLMTRWFKYTSELTEVWFQLVGMTAGGQMPRAAAWAGAPAPQGPAPTAGPVAGEPTRVGVQVRCSRPVEVVLDLRPLSGETPLRVHDLRAADAEKPRITGVRIERVQGRDAPLLCIEIPEDQPPGIYSGLVLDEATSLPAGTVAVRIP